jgi:hypothetical protein
VAARRDGVVELVEEEAGDGELRRHAVRDEDAAGAHQYPVASAASDSKF